LSTCEAENMSLILRMSSVRVRSSGSIDYLAWAFHKLLDFNNLAVQLFE